MTNLPTIYVDGTDDEVVLPYKFKVCADCPITAEEWDRDWHEDEAAYLRGEYDEICPTCKRQRVIAVVNRGVCTPEQLASWDEQERERADRRD